MKPLHVDEVRERNGWFDKSGTLHMDPVAKSKSKPARKSGSLVEARWEVAGSRVVLWIAAQVVSEVNGKQAGEHWSKTAKRRKQHHEAVANAIAWGGPVRSQALVAALASIREHLRSSRKVSIEFTRLMGSRLAKPLDPDALAIGHKAVCDAVTRWVGVDDGSPLYTFSFQQHEHSATGVRVVIQTEGECNE